jgi:hypothetical protein
VQEIGQPFFIVQVKIQYIIFDLELVLGPGCIFEGDHITRPYGGGQ